MHRAALTPLVAAAAAAACTREAPAAAGPAYTPAVADALKALAADCELRPGADGETRACRGRQTSMTIELDRARRLRSLDVSVLASTGVWEAWTLLEHVLPAVAAPPVVDAARKRLTGEPADEVVGGVRVATAILGERYAVKLTWGR